MAQTTASGPLGDTNELFDKAKHGFLSVLSPEEAATFASWTGQTTPDVLMAEAKRISELFKDKSRSFRIYAQVSSFGESIRPYFEVLGIVVSSHPEWAAIAWGALRLILQLASNYTSFFEKLTDLLAEVGRIVPRFKDLAELVCDHSLASQRVKAAIQGFYTDLFALYQAVALVFTKKSGKRKKTHQVIGHLMWTPFESRFQNIVSKIKHHGKAIDDELHILTLRRFVEIQNTLSHQTQTTTKIKDDVHDQIRSAEEVRNAIHDINEAIQNQSLALTQYLAEYRQLQETQNSRLGVSRDEILNFLDPPGEFAQELEDASRLRDPGSGTWVFSEPDFVEWMTSNSAATLWIKGKPGCGKSILASGIIDNLADLATRDERPQIFYFFFTMRNPRLQSTDHACRAILSQILDRNYSEHRILRAFDYAMSKRKDGQVKATSGIIRDLLDMAFEALPGSFIVLDGIDECVIPNAIGIQEHDQLLVKFLDSLLSDLQKSRTKILFLSRPSIRQMGPLMAQSHIRSIHITPESNAVDLRRYCTTRLQSLVSERLLPAQTPGDLEELTDTLLTGADGMFLWARLMFSYLRSPYLAPNHSIAATIRLSNIKRLRYPETLDMMYSRILDLIGRLDTQMRRQARRTFCWLLFPKRNRLAAMELHEILTVSSLDGDFDEDTTRFIKDFDCQQNFSAMDESIISACSSLVELSRDAEGPFYRFIHQTAIEFFLKRYESKDLINQFRSVGGFLGEGCGPQGRPESDVYAFFLLCPTEVEMELTVACITYLRARITSGPLSGNILQTTNRSHIANKYSFLTYASSFWTAHLRQTRPACAHNTYSGNLRGLEENFTGFLEARYTIMTWIEAMYLLGKPEDIFRHGPNISHWVSLSQDGSGIGLDLCHDLETLDNDWGSALREAPDHIWNDITAFFNSKFFVQTSGTRVTSLAPRSSDISSQSSKSLSSISVSDTTDSHMAILSIWPSREFELIWHEVMNMENVQQLFSACHGWVARYEVWNTTKDSPTPILNHRVPLDPCEIRIQLQHFLQRSPRRGKSILDVAGAGHTMRKLAVSFPTTISCHDLSIFTILRTIYKFQHPSTPMSSIGVQSFLIPLDFNENMKAIWGSDTVPTGQPASSGSGAGRAIKSLAYTYGFEFSHGNKYLLYRDTAGMSILPNGEMKLATTIAMFQIPQSTSWSGQSIRFLSQIESKPPEHYYSSWAIHPELPIMAIFSRSLNGPPILLWDFEDTSQLFTENPPSLSVSGTVSNMSFSECGKSLVIQRLGYPHPLIKSVEKCTCFKRRGKRREGNSKPHQETQSIRSLVHRTTKLGDIMAYHNGTLRSGEVQSFVGSDGRKHSQQLRVDKAGVQGITLVQNHREEGDDLITHQPIIALPSTQSVSSLQVNMQMPQSIEEPVRLIVNKSAQPLYSLDDKQDGHFPAIISKSQKALRPAQGKHKREDLLETDYSSKTTKKLKYKTE